MENQNQKTRKFCWKCGERTLPNTNFCTKCGIRLNEAKSKSPNAVKSSRSSKNSDLDSPEVQQIRANKAYQAQFAARSHYQMPGQLSPNSHPVVPHISRFHGEEVSALRKVGNYGNLNNPSGIQTSGAPTSSNSEKNNTTNTFKESKVPLVEKYDLLRKESEKQSGDIEDIRERVSKMEGTLERLEYKLNAFNVENKVHDLQESLSKKTKKISKKIDNLDDKSVSTDNLDESVERLSHKIDKIQKSVEKAVGKVENFDPEALAKVLEATLQKSVESVGERLAATLSNQIDFKLNRIEEKNKLRTQKIGETFTQMNQKMGKLSKKVNEIASFQDEDISAVPEIPQYGRASFSPFPPQKKSQLKSSLQKKPEVTPSSPDNSAAFPQKAPKINKDLEDVQKSGINAPPQPENKIGEKKKEKPISSENEEREDDVKNKPILS